MSPPHHWTWTGSELLTENAALLRLADTKDIRGNTGALSLFYTTKAGAMMNARQRVAGDSASWEVQPGPLAKPHTAVKAQQFAIGHTLIDGLDLFAVSPSHEVSWFRQTAFGTPWLTVNPPPFSGRKTKQVEAAADSQGQIQLVALTTNGKVFIQRQIAALDNGWLPQLELPGVSAKHIAIAANANNAGLLEIFFIDQHDVLSHLRQTAITGDLSGWSAATPLLPTKTTAILIEVGQNIDGRLELFCIDTNHDLFHVWQTSTANTTQWSQSVRFPGPLAKQLAVAANQDGRLELFYVGTDDRLYHDWQSVPAGTWVGETVIPNYSAKQLAVGRNVGGGALELFWVDGGSSLQHSRQSVPNAGWINANATGGNVAPPVPFGGNENFLLVTGNCGLLTDVAVAIVLTEDLAFSANGKPDPGDDSFIGLSWQLNCVGRLSDIVVIQQYSIEFSGHQIFAQVDNFSADPNVSFASVINTKST